MTPFMIQPFTPAHQLWAEQFLHDHWGSSRMVTRGKLYNVLDFPGFVAEVAGEPQGLVTYHLEATQCEVLILLSRVEGIGAGWGLIERVKQVAQESGCKRLWLITTNDNIHAIRWYQRRGFIIAAVHINALAESRKLKPEIPLLGNEGIPLRDEIEFEMTLT